LHFSIRIGIAAAGRRGAPRGSARIGKRWISFAATGANCVGPDRGSDDVRWRRPPQAEFKPQADCPFLAFRCGGACPSSPSTRTSLRWTGELAQRLSATLSHRFAGNCGSSPILSPCQPLARRSRLRARALRAAATADQAFLVLTTLDPRSPDEAGRILQGSSDCCKRAMVGRCRLWWGIANASIGNRGARAVPCSKGHPTSGAGAFAVPGVRPPQTRAYVREVADQFPVWNGLPRSGLGSFPPPG
jgi:hypothetical protein